MKVTLKCGCILVIKPFDMFCVDIDSICEMHMQQLEDKLTSVPDTELLTLLTTDVVKCEWA
jgi:hypothetical protein